MCAVASDKLDILLSSTRYFFMCPGSLEQFFWQFDLHAIVENNSSQNIHIHAYTKLWQQRKRTPARHRLCRRRQLASSCRRPRGIPVTYVHDRSSSTSARALAASMGSTESPTFGQLAWANMFNIKMMKVMLSKERGGQRPAPAAQVAHIRAPCLLEEIAETESEARDWTLKRGWLLLARAPPHNKLDQHLAVTQPRLLWQ